jgi:flagellar motor switch protein FliN
MSRDDATVLAKVVLGLDEEPAGTAIGDMLKEVAGQAVGSLGQTPVGQHQQFRVDAPVLAEAELGGRASAHRIDLGETCAPVVGAWVVAGVDEAAAPAGLTPAAPRVPSPPAAASPSQLPPSMTGAPANLDVILDIDLPLTVRFGQTEMSLEALTRLGPGSVIDLGRPPEDPVEVLVNGRLVARADVVVVGGNYGVRILEVVSPADRVRSLGV